MTKKGELFIVATPIGNLADITLRALETLKQVDLIAAEDTRHSATLLMRYGIKTQVISLHSYNETKRSQFILDQLQQGKNIALITDAGTPLISDPGNYLVQTIQKNGLRVIPIPGVCAAITALSISGLPANKFVFEGFLPPKPQQQLRYLRELRSETRTMIFYESPHRLLATVTNMISVFGECRRAVLTKELTKTFETIYSNTLYEIKEWLLAESKHQKGEFVFLVTGINEEVVINHKVIDVLELLSKDMSPKQAIILTAKITGANKNELYKVALQSLHVKKYAAILNE
ncbi:MAG: 16S rRNA (cytidine(1402)-2'-O)-methyltransferase [Coxiellaceae bacterium]|jgi:16S rRNA (cytidine1402-2'-O)-methyltransferase|nr:16S rRNA (cytidine(1402)-2'-O)-methyltransferase [Coxiellaceae bacterium]